MLTCREVMHRLSDYLAGKLTTEMSQHISWHLGHCPDCKLVLNSAQRTLRKYFAASARPSRTSQRTAA